MADSQFKRQIPGSERQISSSEGRFQVLMGRSVTSCTTKATQSPVPKKKEKEKRRRKKEKKKKKKKKGVGGGGGGEEKGKICCGCGLPVGVFEGMSAMVGWR